MTLKGHSDSITGLALNPDGTHLLSNAADNSLRMWDLRPYAPANRCEKIFTGHQHNYERNLLRCSWSSDGSKVCLCFPSLSHELLQYSMLFYVITAIQSSTHCKPSSKGLVKSCPVYYSLFLAVAILALAGMGLSFSCCLMSYSGLPNTPTGIDIFRPCLSCSAIMSHVDLMATMNKDSQWRCTLFTERCLHGSLYRSTTDVTICWHAGHFRKRRQNGVCLECKHSAN